MNNSASTPISGSRHFNTPSPVVFPSASPTPKLFSTPTKKLAEVKTPWQEVEIEAVPQQHHSANNSSYNTIIYNTNGLYQCDHHNHNYDHHYNSREKPNHTPTPLSTIMLDSDILLDDQEDISSYKFSEEDFLSSIVSSRSLSTSSISASSPFYHRRGSDSFSSPSPQQFIDELNEEDMNDNDDDDRPIVGSPFAPVPNEDPIIERPRRFSADSPLPGSYKTQQNAATTTATANKNHSNDCRTKTTTATKANLLGALGKNFISRMKKKKTTTAISSSRRK